MKVKTWFCIRLRISVWSNPELYVEWQLGKWNSLAVAASDELRRLAQLLDCPSAATVASPPANTSGRPPAAPARPLPTACCLDAQLLVALLPPPTHETGSLIAGGTHWPLSLWLNPNDRTVPRNELYPGSRSRKRRSSPSTPTRPGCSWTMRWKLRMSASFAIDSRKTFNALSGANFTDETPGKYGSGGPGMILPMPSMRS
mmetsp:Transcript_98035/g.282782  ORF Transcript_98035/g.282782 Transcript_98035/m.282782 type:complete len:201 (-) Transcript_98035:173-775(-)